MHPRIVSFALAAVIVSLDRITKMWVEKSVELHATIPVLPGFFNLVHTQNRGMAFGLFNDAPSPMRTFVLIGVSMIVLGFVVALIWRQPRSLPPSQHRTPWALGLILGGAVGNLYDRIAQGSVTDFLEFYAGQFYWPAFNVADSAITVGAVLLAMDLLRAPASVE